MPGDAIDMETRNLYLLAQHVTQSARERDESRGAHFRSDFPLIEPALDHRHQILVSDRGHAQRRFGELASVLGTPATPGSRAETW